MALPSSNCNDVVSRFGNEGRSQQQSTNSVGCDLEDESLTYEPEMDARYTHILIEGERLPDDDEHYLHSTPKLDAPHSAPHSRSSSFKNRPRPRLNLDILAAQRPRTNSLPNAYLPLPDPLYMPETGRIQRVRSFKTTSKGLINHGDSFKKSNNSLASNGSVGSVRDGTRKSSRRSSPVPDGGEDQELHKPVANPDIHIYRVLMMGAQGVGKTALTRQFMTSEYKGTYTESNTPDILEPERNVHVMLDGLESTLHFLDVEQHPDFEEEEIPIDAYVVVFSVSSVISFNYAIKSLRSLREECRTNKAIILVGNKIDLVRQRRVTKHDALAVTKKYTCRYTETSAALNHHVDELLVGILSQIREQIAPNDSNSKTSKSETDSRPKSKSSGKAITEFFSKIFGTNTKKAKSCEILFVE